MLQGIRNKEVNALIFTHRENSMEKLHFQAESTANLVKLSCTILFEKGNRMDDLGAVWHEYFNGDKGDRLFQRFMEEAFPNGCTIGEKELMQITNKAISFLETDVSALEAKAAIDKRRFAYWVYFAPTHTVSGCWFAEHEETVIQILTNYFGKSIEDFTTDDLKRFIIASFEIRSDNSSVRSIADDAEFIQRAVRTRSVRLKERMEHYGV